MLLENKLLIYLNYKFYDIFKVFVGVSMIGVVVFVLRLWLGFILDVEIIRKSGLFKELNNGDVVMVDKGFIYI